MNYFCLQTKIFTSFEFSSASLKDRGTWITLIDYCACAQNGGVIKGGSAWSERTWISATGLKKDDIHRKSTLWRHKKGDIHVLFYPKNYETDYKKAQQNG